MSGLAHAGFALLMALLLAGAAGSLPVHYRFVLRFTDPLYWCFRAGFFKKEGPSKKKKKPKKARIAGQKRNASGFLLGAARRQAGKFLQKVNVQRLYIGLNLGIAEAPDATALILGALEGFFCGIAAPLVPAGNTKIALVPEFSQDRLQGEIECIFWIRAWNIIGIGINVIKEYIQWRTIPSKTL